MGNDDKRWWGLWRAARRKTRTSSDVAAIDASGRPASPRSVDVELVIQAARFAVSTRTASSALFVRHLSVTEDVADQLLGRLEHCEVVGPSVEGKPRRVIPTSAELPGVVAEFERRHRDGAA